MKRLFARCSQIILPLSVLFLSIQTSWGASATWLSAPPTGDWNSAANWTAGGPPNSPSDTATFATSTQTAVSLSSGIEVDGIVFDPAGSAYTIAATSASSLAISGAGIVNNSGITQSFMIAGPLLVFMNSATAGSSTSYMITGDVAGGGSQGLAYFLNTSTAGGGTFINDGGAAGGAGGSVTYFSDAATAGQGTFINSGGAVGAANGGSTYFASTSTAGTGIFSSDGGVASGAFGGLTFFYDNSSADSATLIAYSGTGGGEGGRIAFYLDAIGGMSRIQVFGNGNLDITLHNAPGVTIGSLEGSGPVFLGALNLTVGSNNLSTDFSGAIQDEGVGGSFTKIGTGTLTLSGANTHTGGTSIIAGTLQATHDGALGSGDVSLPASGATLILQSGATNNYVADTATLSIAGGSIVELDFTGTPDAVHSLIVDGVPQIDGLYGSAASGAPHQLPQLAGSGELLVTSQPTPSPTPGPPVIISPLTAAGTVGQPFVYQFEATGATKLGVTNLPSGLTFNVSLSAIIGTPAAEGTFPVGLSASNTIGTTNATLTLTVQPAPSSGPVIRCSTGATGRVGQPFTFRVITTGGSPAARLSASGLPAGLSADAVTGVISGTVSTEGSSTVTLTVRDGNLTTTSVVQLTFSADPALPVIVSPDNASLTVGQPFSYTIRAPSSAGPSDPTIFTLIGTLPAGLQFDPSAGTITGTYSPRPASRRGGRSDAKDLSGGALLGSIQLFGTNSHGTSTIQLLFLAAPSGAVNIATRLLVGTGQNVLIGGFIVQGNAPKVVIIRALGPSTGIPGALQDPTLELHDGAHPNVVVFNDNWKDSQEQIIRDTGIPPTDDRESAIVVGLDPGNYTAIVAGKNGTTGIGLVEVYDLGTASLDTSSLAKLGNIATRGFVDIGNNVMIGGFIVRAQPTRVVLRAIGPSLSAFGVANALQDTVLELHDSSGSLVASNDDWRSTQEQEIIATGLAPTDNRESAIVATLNPGAYTGIARGANNTTGVALVEVYGLQ